VIPTKPLIYHPVAIDQHHVHGPLVSEKSKQKYLPSIEKVYSTVKSMEAKTVPKMMTLNLFCRKELLGLSGPMLLLLSKRFCSL
jgi:hypothetical protein